MAFWNSGGIAGSLLGGRWSDYELTRLKTDNGGKIYPEVSRSVFIVTRGTFAPFFFFSGACYLRMNF